MTVLSKLEQGQEARRQNSCFLRFTLIKIASCHSYREAWALEHALILRWQPTLNIPFVHVFLKRTALGFRPAEQRRRTAYSEDVFFSAAGDMLHGMETSLGIAL